MIFGADDDRRVALFHGAILCASLTAATLAYTQPQWTPHDATAMVVPASPQGPLTITYAEANTAVAVERDAQGRVTVDVTAAGPTPNHARYHGNTVAQHLLETLLPLEARRPLGMLDTAHRTSFGLEPAEATLVVATQAQRTAVALGHTLYGAGDVYALVEGRGGYVLPAGLTRNFQQAGFALWDRRFLRADHTRVQRFEAHVDGRTCRFVRTSRDDGTPTFSRDTSLLLRDVPAESLLAAWVNLQLVKATETPPQTSAAQLGITWFANEPGTAHIAANNEHVVGICDAQFGPVALPADEIEALWKLAREACPEDKFVP